MATLFTTLLATGGGAAAAGGAAATGAAAAGGGLFSLAGLSTTLTIVGGLAGLAGANQEAAALEGQAADEEARAVQETIQGKQDALDAMRALNRDTAQIAVAGFASGLGSEGSVETAQQEAEKIGEQNVRTARLNADARSAGRRGNARQLRKSAKGARLGGIFGAVSSGFSLLDRRTARGVE